MHHQRFLYPTGQKPPYFAVVQHVGSLTHHPPITGFLQKLLARFDAACFMPALHFVALCQDEPIDSLIRYDLCIVHSALPSGSH